tara:strand:- start:4842 stop:5798 length:957 start_codon:yes stop_codon:yes gene_type:complete
MKFKKPKFWDRRKPNILAYLLSPFTLIIKINNLFLNSKSKEKFREITTICVGNIYLGGTGKTPTTIKLYELLRESNFKVCTAKKIYSDQKDEEIMLKKRSKFISAKNRKEIIQSAIKNKYELVIFDDGLQDREIDYSLKFVCFDTQNWIGNGCLIPSGPLREKVESLKKYDAVILKNIEEKSNLDEIKLTINNINPDIKIFNSILRIENLKEFNLDNRFLIFSGIGNNDSFRKILEKNNFIIDDGFVFPDHFEYQDKDIIRLLKIAEEKNIKVITTEKDYVKIPIQYKKKINLIKINLEILEQPELIKLIKSKINENN